jgi:hypothetical protein
VARSGRAATRSSPSECCAKQAVDLVAHFARRQAVVQLELHEPDEQRIERTPSGQELLRDVRERVASRDHSGESGDLAASALGVTDGSGPLVDGVRRAHGRTKTAPVIPAAA